MRIELDILAVFTKKNGRGGANLYLFCKKKNTGVSKTTNYFVNF